MKTVLAKSSLISFIALAAGLQVQAGTTTPSRVSTSQFGNNPYYYSGVVVNDSWRGSGTVAAHPKVVVSCAHVTYENGTWLRGNKFNRAWNSSSSPYSASSTQDLRGYWYWTSYSSGKYDADFVAYYAYANLANGGHTGYSWSDSTTSHPLNSTSTSKMIVGYPGSDGYYMNSVGSFTSRYTQRNGHYFWNNSVKGGKGMSGGGVFAYTNSQWRLAGVHVSGNTDGSLGAGVRALNGEAYQLISKAITSSAGSTTPNTTTRTFSSSSRLNIPDNRTTWTVRSLSVSSMPSSISSVKVSVNISHAYRGDLEVTLTSPAGRTYTLHNRTGTSADNVIISDKDLTSSYSGSNPNGTWKLSMRDLASRDAGWLNSVSLTISAR